jgi:hypothetical protein
MVLVACKPTDEPQQLPTPTNLSQQGDLLTWDAVEDAAYYTIEINGDEIRVSETEYSLLELRNGTYNVRIRANRMGSHSAFSDSLEVVIDRTYDNPRALRLIDGALMWDIDGTPESYEVRVNGVTDTTTDMGRTLLLEENTFYDIQVRAIYPGGESSWSLSLYHHTYATATTTVELSFNRLLPLDLETELVVTNPIALFRNNDGFLVDGLLSGSDPLTIQASWLAVLEVGQHTIDVIDANGRTTITLDVYEDDKPVLLDPNTIAFTGIDLSFTFALFGGEITSIDGQGITEDDYTIDGETLTIQASFFQGIIDDDPDREMIILSYQLTHDDDITLGYLFVSVPTE